MSIVAGERFTPEMIEFDRNRIYSLGLFTSVDLFLDTLGARSILRVMVDERWYVFPCRSSDSGMETSIGPITAQASTTTISREESEAVRIGGVRRRPIRTSVVCRPPHQSCQPDLLWRPALLQPGTQPK